MNDSLHRSTTRVLILGAGGMFGHKLLQRLSPRFSVVGAVRDADEALQTIADAAGATLLGGLDVQRFETVADVLRRVQPSVVVNCVGVIKQRPEANDVMTALRVNSVFPRQLTTHLADSEVRVIHFSTDCVFSGRSGGYAEDANPDAEDLYGISKLLGEVDAPNGLTLRTSMIGRELRGFHSLLEWLLRQPPGATVRGFTNAIFSGLTTVALADEVGRLIEHHADVAGLYHVSADPISKFDLLTLARDVFRLDCDIVPDPVFHCDRSLRSERYRSRTGFKPASWESMMRTLASDPTPYERLRLVGSSP